MINIIDDLKRKLDILNKDIKGDVMYNDDERIIYSRGASIYKIIPIVVITPKEELDIIKVVSFAKEHSLSITCRGSGTSRVDASLNNGIILDMSKYMKNIVEIEDEYITVEPGITCKEVNTILKQNNKVFLPNPSSRDFCSIGGMAAMNASGENSLKYGDTFENIESIVICLNNGELVEIYNKYYDEDELQNETLRKIYMNVKSMLLKNSALIEQSKPDAIRNCDGFNIWNCYKNEKINIMRLIIGSEGTLGLITRLKLRIFSIRNHIGAVSIGLNSYDKLKLTEITAFATKFNPSAIEFIDNQVLCLRKKYTPSQVDWVDDKVNNMLFIEFEEYNNLDLEEKIFDLIENLSCNYPDIFINQHRGQDEFDKALSLRRGTQGLKNRENVNGQLAVAVIEDASVHPSKVYYLIEDLKTLCNKHNLNVFIVGHVGVGNIHLYPTFDLTDYEFNKRISLISHDFVKLIVKYNGCISAEHGIGITRKNMLMERYNKNIVNIFSLIKQYFDNKNIFNPFKIISLECNYNSYQHRSNYQYNQELLKRYQVNQDIINSISKCHGCGKCRSFCPSYLKNRDEACSPRGRIILLHDILSGNISEEIINNNLTMKSFNTCFKCKICKEKCFDNIDISQINRILTRIYGFKRLKDDIYKSTEELIERIL